MFPHPTELKFIGIYHRIFAIEKRIFHDRGHRVRAGPYFGKRKDFHDRVSTSHLLDAGSFPRTVSATLRPSTARSTPSRPGATPSGPVPAPIACSLHLAPLVNRCALLVLRPHWKPFSIRLFSISDQVQIIIFKYPPGCSALCTCMIAFDAAYLISAPSSSSTKASVDHPQLDETSLFVHSNLRSLTV